MSGFIKRMTGVVFLSILLACLLSLVPWASQNFSWGSKALTVFKPNSITILEENNFSDFLLTIPLKDALKQAEWKGNTIYLELDQSQRFSRERLFKEVVSFIHQTYQGVKNVSNIRLSVSTENQQKIIIQASKERWLKSLEKGHSDMNAEEYLKSFFSVQTFS